MKVTRLHIGHLVISGVLVLATGSSWADEVVVGVNLVNAPYDLNSPEQEAVLAALEDAGVPAIRAAIPNNEKGIRFAQRVYAHKIKIELLVGLEYPGTKWPRAPDGFQGMWQLPGLTRSNPVAFRSNFESLLGRLEESGIVLVAFELGNEINWAGFNADFPLPGKGKVLGSEELLVDPEGRQIAKGFLQYLKSLGALREVRDRSKLNRDTPIISAGLADLSGTNWTTTTKADAVSVDATLNFLRANGLDILVDGYGLHSYPSVRNPGSVADAAMRLAHMESNGLKQCRPGASPDGKPCWFTEWGFNNVGDACPVDDAGRVSLVREMRDRFSRLAIQGRLGGLFFYTWQGNVHAQREDRASAYRCGALTQSGRLAIAPMSR